LNVNAQRTARLIGVPLAAELAATNEKLSRLYHAIESGIIDLDAQLKERVDALQAERKLAQASIDRIAVQANTRAMITSDRLKAFSQLVREKFDTGDTQARKAFLQSVISKIEVDDDKIRIIGDKATLAAHRRSSNRRGPSWFCTQMARLRGFELLNPRLVERPEQKEKVAAFQ
jgi:hypothetical protein